jgi:hypothetical protein
VTELFIAAGLGSLPPERRHGGAEGSDSAVLIVGVDPRLLGRGDVIELLGPAVLSALADDALAIAEERTDAARNAELTGVALRATLLGSAAKLDTLTLATHFLTAVAALRAAVSHLGPVHATWYGDDQLLATAIAAAAGVDELAHAPTPRTRQGRSERLVRWLKRRRFDATVRYLSTLPRAVRSRRAVLDFTGRVPSAAARRSGDTDGGGPVLALFDVRNSGMIANLAAVTDAVRARGVHCVGLYMEPRVAAVLERDHPTLPILPLAAFGGSSVVRGALSQASAVRRAMTDDVRRGSAAGAVAAPVSDVAALRGYLAKRLSWASVAQGLVDLAALENALSVLGPRALVTSSDAHRYSRLAVLTASRRDVRSMVLQHGAPVGERIYLPVTADVMATWGPWCLQWFADRGVPGPRLVAAGYPRGSTRSATTRPPGDARTLLFAAQPVADDVTQDLLERVFATMGERSDLELTVRPHPGESRRAVLAAIVARAPTDVQRRVRLSAAGVSLAEDVGRAYAVVTSESTVGIDALSAGVPLVLLTHPALRRAIPFVEFQACREAANPAELSAALAALDTAQEVDRLRTGARRFLDAYVGPVGDEAAGNVADALLAGTWPA